jgi:hypothetical protein
MAPAAPQKGRGTQPAASGAAPPVPPAPAAPPTLTSAAAPAAPSVAPAEPASPPLLTSVLPPVPAAPVGCSGLVVSLPEHPAAKQSEGNQASASGRELEGLMVRLELEDRTPEGAAALERRTERGKDPGGITPGAAACLRS